MLKRILVLFALIPLIDIFLLFKIGQEFGAAATFLLVVGFGAIGVFLIKGQGLNMLHRVRADISYGHLPGDTILDGLLVLAGGLLLIVPGIITAIIGLTFMVPAFRHSFRELLKVWLIKQLHSGRWHIQFKGW